MEWRIEKGDDLSHEVWSEQGECIAEVYSSEQDARLVSAAPDLFACVKGLLSNFPELLTDEHVSGANIVDWLTEQRCYWQDALHKAEGDKVDAYLKEHMGKNYTQADVTRALFEMECE